MSKLYQVKRPIRFVVMAPARKTRRPMAEFIRLSSSQPTLLPHYCRAAARNSNHYVVNVDVRDWRDGARIIQFFGLDASASKLLLGPYRLSPS
jgi:hypothetical protein